MDTDKPTVREYLLKYEEAFAGEEELVNACVVKLGVTRSHVKDVIRDLKQKEHFQTKQVSLDSYEGISTIPKTPEQLEMAISIDREKWEAYRGRCNFWGNELNPNYQVKFDIRLKKEWVAQRVAEQLQTSLKDFSPKFKKLTYPTFPQENCLLISMLDPHLGNESYDGASVEKTLSKFETCFMDFLRLSEIYSVSEIVFPVGNDFFDMDTIQGTTTSGTYTGSNPLKYKTFAQSFKVLCRCLENARQVAPVKVYIVEGNHDKDTDYFLGFALNERYRNCNEIEIYNSIDETGYRPFHFYKWGLNLFGLAHGKEINSKRLPLLMPVEASEKWGGTKYWTWLIGHYHIGRIGDFVPMDERSGIRIRWMPGLTDRSNWTKMKGYSSLSEAIALLVNKQSSIIGEFPKRYLREEKC